MIGAGEPRRVEISILHSSASQTVPPFLPASLREDLYPGGNSLCYAVQLAHLMGAGRIVAVGFTMQSGSRYQHEGGNPVHRTELTRYGDISRPLAWLEWYCRENPNKLHLDSSFEGPLYERLHPEAAPRFPGRPN